MSGFQAIDFIFIILIALIVIHGYVRGFVTEFFSWAALAAAILAAVFFYSAGAAFIRKNAMPDVRYVPEILGFMAVFLIVMLICKMIERLFRDVVAGANLGILDKFVGAIFGLIEGLTLTALIIFVLAVQPLVDASKLIGDSVFAQIFLPHFSRIPFNWGKGAIDVVLFVPPFSWLGIFRADHV
jgi:membrane protein required for colicin V production